MRATTSARRGAAALLSTVLAASLVGVLPQGTPALAARATRATTTTTAVPRVNVGAPRGLPASVGAAALAAAGRARARATVVEGGTLDLVSRSRAASMQWVAPAGRIVPVSTTAVDPAAAGVLYGLAVATTLRAGQAVLTETSAKLRGARVGDVLGLVGWTGTPVLVTVGAVVPDARGSSAELLIGKSVAAMAGSLRPESVAIYSIGDRVLLDRALGTGLPRSQMWRVRRSWDPPDIDAVLSQAQLKTALGEFAVTRVGTDVALEPAWLKANIVRTVLPIVGTVSCHKKVIPDARAALAELESAGLSKLINAYDSRVNGGCFGARELRTVTGTSGRTLSRHTWGAAIDINPSTNRFGAKPRIDPRVVDVFRRHGFAWGGTFTIPDGMHFEWIGTPRVTGPPLTAPPTTTTSTTTSTTTTTTTTTTTPPTTTTVTTTVTTTTPATSSTLTSTTAPAPASTAPPPATGAPPTATTTEVPGGAT